MWSSYNSSNSAHTTAAAVFTAGVLCVTNTKKNLNSREEGHQIVIGTTIHRGPFIRTSLARVVCVWSLLRGYRAKEALEQSQIEHGMRGLTKHGHHLSLVASLQLALEDKTPARIRDVFPLYRRIAEHSDVDPLVRRRMHDHLADLAILGILDRHVRNEGRAGGQYYEYAFNVPLELVIRVVMDFEGVAFPRGTHAQEHST